MMVASLRKGQVTEYILYFISTLRRHFLPKSASSAPSTPNIHTYTHILLILALSFHTFRRCSSEGSLYWLASRDS